MPGCGSLCQGDGDGRHGCSTSGALWRVCQCRRARSIASVSRVNASAVVSMVPPYQRYLAMNRGNANRLSLKTICKFVAENFGQLVFTSRSCCCYSWVKGNGFSAQLPGWVSCCWPYSLAHSLASLLPLIPYLRGERSRPIGTCSPTSLDRPSPCLGSGARRIWEKPLPDGSEWLDDDDSDEVLLSRQRAERYSPSLHGSKGYSVRVPLRHIPIVAAVRPPPPPRIYTYCTLLFNFHPGPGLQSMACAAHPEGSRLPGYDHDCGGPDTAGLSVSIIATLLIQRRDSQTLNRRNYPCWSFPASPARVS